MSDEEAVMAFDKRHFVVRLCSTLLKVDLKEGARRELEKLMEASPIFRDSVGLLFQTMVPLDVRLRDRSSVGLDKKGRVKVDIPSRKDLIIPVDENEAERLIEKLNELIPKEKERALRDMEEAKTTEESFESMRWTLGEGATIERKGPREQLNIRRYIDTITVYIFVKSASQLTARQLG
jgi:hypothetical protein